MKGFILKSFISLPGTPARVSSLHIGSDLLENLTRELFDCLGGRKAYWVWVEAVWALWGEKLASLLGPSGKGNDVILFAASEHNKRLDAVEGLARKLVRAGADRGSVLVAVGGGVTGDVTGFLASIYMRGISYFQLPTTLLAQVDSSVGGKTGVDLPEGKNLIGTFHQPEAVWMDVRFLQTLPDEEFRQGMAEVIKTAMIGHEELWARLESDGGNILRRDKSALIWVVSQCCAVKSRVVEADEKESGYRRVLNLGHTVGHAIERLSEYEVRHGDAVAMGMVAAARLALRLGMILSRDVDRLIALCEFWGLPVRIPAQFTADDILQALGTDKKKVGETLHFILPVKIGEVIDYPTLNLEDLKQVLLLRDGVEER
jgi:3-dehydroquinate synthase